MFLNKFERGNVNVSILFFHSLDILEGRSHFALRDPAEAHEELFTLLELVEGGEEDLFLVEEQLVELNEGDIVFDCIWQLRDLLDIPKIFPKS